MKRTAWAGWVIFAAVMLMVTGAVNVIEGIAALVQDKRVVLVEGYLYLVDVTGWGWALLLFGLALLAIGLGLLVGQKWARILAIVVVAVHAVLQVFWIGAYPLWSIMMIGLDTVVIYALTARWPEAQGDEPGLAAPERAVRQEDPAPHPAA